MSEAVEKYWDRKTWLHYIMGYLTVKGFKIRKVYVESFKKAFPEVPSELLNLITIKEEEPMSKKVRVEGKLDGDVLKPYDWDTSYLKAWFSDLITNVVELKRELKLEIKISPAKNEGEAKRRRKEVEG